MCTGANWLLNLAFLLIVNVCLLMYFLFNSTVAIMLVVMVFKAGACVHNTVTSFPCRVATTGLLALLCSTYPQYHIIFILLIALDIFSHWFQMYSTLLAGSSTHKVSDCAPVTNRLVKRLICRQCCVSPSIEQETQRCGMSDWSTGSCANCCMQACSGSHSCSTGCQAIASAS
eukprot:GHRR01007946.1.p1 GENE.GHRR01007946.1~~GHRR01007946.1.p1  ORF type:complete len:173 (-),score=43.28 GHRR01007946.1:166-684(-)